MRLYANYVAFNHTNVIQGDDKITSLRGYPQRLRSDNGPELISKKLETWVKAHDVVLDLIELGKTAQNAYIERFNRTYCEEVLSLYLFSSLSEIREITEQWPKEYNAIRPHDSLGGMTQHQYVAVDFQKQGVRY